MTFLRHFGRLSGRIMIFAMALFAFISPEKSFAVPACGYAHDVSLYKTEDDANPITIHANTCQLLPTTDANGNALTVPVREGYVFLGYADTPSGEGTFYYDANMEPSNDGEGGSLSLYARWSSSCNTGYHLGESAAAPTLPDSSRPSNAFQYKAISENGNTSNSDNDLGNGEWKANWKTGDVTGTLKGRAICTNESGTREQTTSTDFPEDSTGVYCWCKATEWNGQSLSAAWVFLGTYNDSDSCTKLCSDNCADGVGGFDGSYRSAVFGAITGVPAQCVGNAYSVAFNANGGTGTMANQGFTYGTAQSLTANTFTRNDYIFAGWNTSADGNGTPYNDAQSVSNLTTEADATVTLYAQWEPVKFSITTTNLSAGDEFKFDMTAVGTFYVDCGVGGILSSNASTNDVHGKKIVREDTSFVKYTCKYSSGGVKTIKFGGLASEYSTSSCSSAISFGHDASAQFIASISGSLGEMFPSYGGDGVDKKPQFCATFQNAVNLTSLPVDANGHSTLFSGISSFGYNMFGYVFAWSGLTSVPSDLFSGISGGTKSYLFMNAFAYCSALAKVTYPDGSETTYLPYNFFGSIDMQNVASGDPFYAIFSSANANFSTTCPAGTTQYTTAYDLNGKVLCQPNTYSVTYDCNGENSNGVSIPEVQLIQYGFKFNNESSCTYTGHTLQGWSCTDASDNVVTLPANNTAWTTVLDNNANVNCVANWGNTVYTINFKDADGNALNVNGATSTTWTFGDEPFELPGENDVLANNSGKLFNAWFASGYNGSKIEGTRFGETISSDYIVSNANNKTLNIYAQLYKESDFTMTTIPITSSNTDVKFHLGYNNGTVYVNWGDGNIERFTDSILDKYGRVMHTYETGKTYVIGLYSENITEYLEIYQDSFYDSGRWSTSYYPMIFFTSDFNKTEVVTHGTPTQIARINGNLSAVFPTVEKDGKVLQPFFMGSFRGCSNLEGPIPENLFANIYGQPVAGMFENTFYGCQKLGSENGVPTYGIPDGLFAGLSGNYTNNLFFYTFMGCSNLTGKIPDNLFGNLYGAPAPQMFNGTFNGCSNLTGKIPDNLFGNLYGVPAANMFHSTFAGCSNLTGPIPDYLFGNLYGAPAENMFRYTFANDENLSGPIPQHLFCSDPDDPTKCINGAPKNRMYSQTFEGCTNLQGNLSSKFFGNISGSMDGADLAFNKTFLNCPGIKGPLPEDLFTGITSVTTKSFYSTFNGTDIGHDKNGNETPVPAGLFSTLAGSATTSSFGPLFANAGITGFKMADETTVSYVPPTFFGSLTRNSSATDVLTDMFLNDNIATSCDVPGTYKYTEGLYGMLPNNKVSCQTCPTGYTSDINDNDTIYRCYNANANCLSVDSYEGVFVSGHLYYAGEGVADSTDECIYNYTVTLEGTEGVQTSFALTTYNKTSTESERTLPTADIMRKPGAIFSHWVDSDGNTVTEIPTTARGPVTYTAQWTACPADSYCPGDNTSVSCASATNNNDYMYSDGEQASINDCYRDCSTEEPYNDVPNATAASGRVHYSANGEIKSCAPANENSCKTGYEYTAGFNPQNLSSVSSYSNKNNTWTATWSEGVVNGVMKGISSCNNDVGNNFSGHYDGDVSEWTRSSNSFNGTETGPNCWCKVTEFGGQELSSEWVFDVQMGQDRWCTDACAYDCSSRLPMYLSFRTAMLNAIQSSPASCLLKTYTITYNDGENTYTAEYNVEMESVQLATPTDKPGYTFDGWYTTADYQSGTKIDSISTSSPSNLTLYAKWDADVYTINFKDADGNALVVDINDTPSTSTTWNYGSGDFALPTEAHVLANNSGKSFNGWWDSGYTKAANDNLHKMNGTKFIDTLSAEYIVTNANENKVLDVYGQLYKTADFKMITVPMVENEDFMFATGFVTGTFYINWGDGNIDKLESTVSNWNKISHTYKSISDNNGVWTIGLYSENVMDYNVSFVVSNGRANFSSPVFFVSKLYSNVNTTPEKLAKIEGNLSAVFPTIRKDDDTVLQPAFWSAFMGCTNLEGAIPENLFANIYDQPRAGMFYMLFTDCTKLGTENGQPKYGIPEHLFCQNKNDPEKCISGVPETSMFSRVFENCSGLTNSIPEHLFGNISGNAAPYMFFYTFYNCSNLTGSIPDNLFGDIYGSPAEGMFWSTFYNCSKLTGSIPENLFSNISGTPAPYMFYETFAKCSSLNKIKTSDAEPTETSYIPVSYLGNISTNTSVANQATNMFMNTGLLATCPEGMYNATLEQFNKAGRPWCAYCSELGEYASDGGNGDATQQCYKACPPTDSFGGTYYSGRAYYTGMETDNFDNCLYAYTITYELDGGTNNANNPASYTAESETITLQAPSVNKPNASFGGWYDNAGFTGDAITTIDTSSKANLTLYAKWTCNTGYVEQGGTLSLPDSSTAPDNTQYKAISANGSTSNADNDLDFGEWKATWTSGDVTGTMKGKAICTTESGEKGQTTSTDFPVNSTGPYCWCKFTEWEEQSLSAMWLLNDDFNDAGFCTYVCAHYCASAPARYSNNNKYEYYTALFNAIIVPSQCVLRTYTVTFDKNGDDISGTMEPQTFSYGVEQELHYKGFNKKYYNFNGWNTEPDGTGTAYADEASITFTDENISGITLYAQWQPEEWDLHYMDHYANEEIILNLEPSKHVYGTETVLPTSVPGHEGLKFEGWFSSPEYEYKIEVIHANDGPAAKPNTVVARWSVDCSTINPTPDNATSVTYGNANEEGRAYCASINANNECVLAKPNACDITDGTCESNYHFDAGVVLPKTSANSHVISTSNQGAGAFSASWDNGVLKILNVEATFSDFSGTPYNPQPDGTTIDSNVGSSATNKYCWCRATSWMDRDDNVYEISMPWLYLCTNCDCLNGCITNTRYAEEYDYTLLNKMFDYIDVTGPQCVLDAYSITYLDSDGTAFAENITPNSYVYGTGLAELPEPPAKTGYTFAGWYDGNEKIESILAAANSNITLTAHWTADQYTCRSGMYYSYDSKQCELCKAGYYCPNSITYTVETNEDVGLVWCNSPYNSSLPGSWSRSECYMSTGMGCPAVVIENGQAASRKGNATGDGGAGYYYYSENGLKYPFNPTRCIVTGVSCNAGYVPSQEPSISKVLDYYSYNDWITGISFSKNKQNRHETGGPVSSRGMAPFDSNFYPGMFGISYGGGSADSITIFGQGLCSTSTTDVSGEFGEPSENAGTNCWCRTTTFRNNETDTLDTALSRYKHLTVFDDTVSCENQCAQACEEEMFSNQTWSDSLVNDAKGDYYCSLNTYTITYELDGGSGVESSATYTINDLPLTLPTNITKDHAGFDGWYDGNNIVTTITTDNMGDKTLTARWKCDDGYEEQGLDLATVIGDAAGLSYSTSGSTWTVDYGDKGILEGQAICSTIPVDNNNDKYPTTYASLTDENGQSGANYCYCNVTGYKANNNSDLQSLSSLWTLYHAYDSESACSNNCYNNCSGRLNYANSNNLVFRTAVFNAVKPSSATCTLKPYTITYNGVDGATNNNPANYTYESETINLSNPTKDGYTFTGWTMNNEPITQIAHNSTGDKTITANWTPIEYTITYELDGGENAQANPSTYTIESANITLVTPTKTHATFGGWCTDLTDDTTCSMSPVIERGTTGDQTFYAKWECNTGYEKKEGSIPALPDTSIGPNNIQYKAHRSDGYTSNADNDLIAGEWKATWTRGNVTGTLKGQALCKSTSGNNHKWHWDGDSSDWSRDSLSEDSNGAYCWCKSTKFKEQDLNAAVIFVNKEGNYNWCAYECARFCADWFNDYEEDDSEIAYRTAMFGAVKPGPAICALETYTITYENVDGATNNNPTEYTYESETINLSNPTKDGYTFEIWTDENGSRVTQIEHNSTGDKTLTANWTAITYNITYETRIRAGNNWLYVDVNMPEDVQYSYNTDTEVTLPVITSENYTFGGWYDNPEYEGQEITSIPAGSMNDKTFYAKWTHVICDEGYYLAHDGVTCGFCPEDSYCPGGTYELYTDVDQGNRHCPEIQNPYGAYNISYYRSDVDVPSTEDTCMVDVYFSGEQDLFTELMDVSPSYDATLPLNINSAFYNVECRYNQQTELYDICRIWFLACKKGYYVPTPPESIDAYDTSTWHNINDLAEICVPAEQNHYTKSDRPLPEEINEEIAEAEQRITELELQIDELEQMDEDEILPENNKTVAENLQYLRQLLEDAQIQVRLQNAEILMFQTAGGSVFNFSEEDDNNVWYYDYVNPLGWNTQDETETLEDQYGECPPEYPNSAAGSWTINQCYATVTFDANNDTNIQTETYYYSAEHANGYIVTLPEPEEPDGLSFGAWFDEEGHAVSGPTVLLQGDKDFTAIWEANIYTISYKLDGGTNNPNNPSTYDVYSQNITLLAPEKDGYMFVGWYDNERFTGDAITTIPTGSIGDKTLYAKWEENCSSNIWLHIGEGRMCLSTTRGENTGNPVLVVQIDGVPYYGMMTPVEDADLPISKCENYHLKMNVNGTVYSVHDKTVNVNSDNMAQCGGACPLYYDTYEELPLDKTPDDLHGCNNIVATDVGIYCFYHIGWHCHHSGGSND